MPAPSKVVIATHNAKKGKEMLTILGSQFPETTFLTLADFPGAPEPEETGSTYRENAVIKAESGLKYTGITCIADDAGLEIDAMDGAPGLYSKRFGGEDLPFPEKMAIILGQLKEAKGSERAARFRCWVAIAAPNMPVETFEGVLEGFIAESPQGSFGFGYDPVFYEPELGCTLAQLSPEEKHRISHRGKVLEKVARYWSSGL